MKTILIVGDSWGVPNYSEMCDTKPEVHTEFRLRNLGYNVFNFSLNGGSMIETIEYARYALSDIPLESTVWLRNAVHQKRNTYPAKAGQVPAIPVPDYRGQKIDWIVWFHTEALRDSVLTYSPTYDFLPLKDTHDLCIKGAYSAFSKLVKTAGSHVKTAIIGGQAPVDHRLYDYHIPNFIIEDWKSELVGKKLPQVSTLSNVDWIERANNSTEEKLEILKNHQDLLDVMYSRNDIFFDSCHPGEKPHGILTEKLHKLFQKDSSFIKSDL